MSVTGVYTLVPAGGTAGGHDYVNTIWVAENGLDTNNGLSIDTPKLTIQAAINAFPVQAGPNVIRYRLIQELIRVILLFRRWKLFCKCTRCNFPR